MEWEKIVVQFYGYGQSIVISYAKRLPIFWLNERGQLLYSSITKKHEDKIVIQTHECWNTIINKWMEHSEREKKGRKSFVFAILFFLLSFSFVKSQENRRVKKKTTDPNRIQKNRTNSEWKGKKRKEKKNEEIGIQWVPAVPFTIRRSVSNWRVVLLREQNSNTLVYK